MREPTNEDRSNWAYTALEAFAAEAGQDTSGDLKTKPEIVLSDMLADLMHYCHAERIDFNAALARGQGHYNDEREEV